MSMSPLAYKDSLRIGSVEFVSPNEIRVSIDSEAPSGVALNTGIPRVFPRINGYVLISADEGYMVAQVEWMTAERAQYPVRNVASKTELLDLPHPQRKMSLNPLGRLLQTQELNGRPLFEFKRGVESYPTVGEAVLLPSQDQLKAIVESGENRKVKIGTSPLAANADVMIDPDRLFGRHLAVLGNTGSGKSCSVAGLIRWSLEAAKKARNGEDPNARFIVLDPNGEYAKTFRDMGKVRVFAVEPDPENDIAQLQIPLWFWNSAEWSAFTQASPKAQKPTLIQALRSVRDGSFNTGLTPSNDMRRYLRTLVAALQMERTAGHPWKGAGPIKGFKERLEQWRTGLTQNDSFSANEHEQLSRCIEHIDSLLQSHQGTWPTAFSRLEIDSLISVMSQTHSTFGGSDADVLPIDADVPRPFNGEQLLRSLAANAELLGVSEYVETMNMRIRTILSDSRMRVISGVDEDISLEHWLTNYICDNKSSNGSVTVIDLSLIPAEVVHIITAVIGRMTLESLQRYRKLNNGRTLPTVLVMEEAHTFIKRYSENGENQSSAEICCQVFEKIAREGRKFGLGLVLSSQRPSELSPTVLSQCNSYLLHRISNDRDQELVHRLVPDNLRGLLRDLPSLPSKNAVLLGWASELPVLVQMNDLKEQHRPKSDDPDFWAVWSGEGLEEDTETGARVEREVDWKEIADDWQQVRGTDENNGDDEEIDEIPF